MTLDPRHPLIGSAVRYRGSDGSYIAGTVTAVHIDDDGKALATVSIVPPGVAMLVPRVPPDGTTAEHRYELLSATADEVAALRERVERLEARLARVEAP